MSTKVLYVHYGDNWIRGSEVCLLNLINNLDSAQFTPVLWTNNPALHQQALASGVESILSEFGVLLGWQGQRVSVSGFISQIKQARDIIRQHQIGLVHVNSGAPCQWMWIAARLSKVSMLTQLHSDYVLRDRLRLCLHLSPHLVTVSRAVSNRLISEGFPERNLSVIHNGIDIDAVRRQPMIDVRQKLNLPATSKIIASVGSLIPRKGMDRLICVVAALRHQQPDLHLLLIGDGPEKTALQQLATELQIADRIHFIGEQKNVGSWLKGGVDLFISGAREEAFGLVLAEAACLSLPIIAPKVGGIPEVLEHDHTALLYDSDHDEMMEEQIQVLLENRPIAETLGRQACQKVQQQFSIEANTNQLMQLYSQLLNRNGKVSRPSLLSVLKPLKQRFAPTAVH